MPFYRTNNMRSVVRLPQVKAQTGLSRSTIYQLMADGNFPKSIALGPRAVGWLASDIDDWIDARIAASRKETLQ
jgi:prophage regulatory protein